MSKLPQKQPIGGVKAPAGTAKTATGTTGTAKGTDPKHIPREFKYLVSYEEISF